MAQKSKGAATPSISFDTSSKDPALVRSRIFVGGINTNIVSREDVIMLFGSYGTILGVTLFNKYAFIQYSNQNEADLAISALNMYHWHGSALDVKLVAPEKVQSNGTTGPSNEDGETDGKRKREELGDTVSDDGKREIPDLFVCGACRIATSSLENFIEHRKKPCEPMQGKKAHGEPEKFECTTCNSHFDLSWELFDHLSTNHNLMVFREPSKA